MTDGIVVILSRKYIVRKYSQINFLPKGLNSMKNNSFYLNCENRNLQRIPLFSLITIPNIDAYFSNPIYLLTLFINIILSYSTYASYIV